MTHNIVMHVVTADLPTFWVAGRRGPGRVHSEKSKLPTTVMRSQPMTSTNRTEAEHVVRTVELGNGTAKRPDTSYLRGVRFGVRKGGPGLQCFVLSLLSQ